MVVNPLELKNNDSNKNVEAILNTSWKLIKVSKNIL